MSNNVQQVGTKQGSREFYSQLEGLRGVAVFLVMISHFVINQYLVQYQFLVLGSWGVNLFFVLSGFLITEILLKDIYHEEGNKKILKKFYIRRTLRIFPIYYLSILVLYFLNVENSDQATVYAATYTYNWYHFITGASSPAMAHFWSLCVEEQFYLIWPMLLIIVKPRHHLKLIIIMMAIGFGSRLLYVGLHLHNYSDFVYTTIACLDCLGMGALLAWLKLNNPEFLRKILKHSSVPVLLTIITVAVSRAGNEIFYITSTLLTALVGFYIIGNGAMHRFTFFGKLLDNKQLRYVGRISYGVYVYHWIFFVLLHDSIVAWLRAMLAEVPALAVLKANVYVLLFVVFVAITVAAAYISYKIIELPVIRLRSFFEKADEVKGGDTEETIVGRSGG